MDFPVFSLLNRDQSAETSSPWTPSACWESAWGWWAVIGWWSPCHGMHRCGS